jgi:hypothetical protein
MGGNNPTRDKSSQTNVPPTMRNETTQQKLARQNNATQTLASGADAYARNKLGIQTTMGGFQDRNVVGYSSSNNPYGSTTQMYGEDYNRLRGEYLASKGQAKGREVIDAMGRTRTVYDPINSSGAYTNVSRGAAQNARDMGTPLSEEMYNSQQQVKQGLMALGGIMSGMPLAFTALYYATKKPYAEAANNFYNKSRTTSTQTNTRDNRDVKTIAASDGQQSSYSQTTARTRYDAIKARTRSTQPKLEGRALYASANKLIKGVM